MLDFVFVLVCPRLLAFARVDLRLGPFSESLKSAFVCVCARLFAFVYLYSITQRS